MNTILYFSTDGAVYETRAYTRADVDRLISDQNLQCLTSADHQFDFWFSPAPQRCQRRINQAATEVLLATTDFTAKNVPLLRGSVVVATHDSDGDLDGLSWQQLDDLARRAHSLSKRDERVLAKRLARDTARKPRPIRTPAPAPVRHAAPHIPAQQRPAAA
jgi:hypothetical protein